jgi:L-ascorbate metabolism protein UlaG (beta-lactamase superfamily)
MLKQFGKLPKGQEKKKIVASAQFADKQFKNELPTVMMAENVTMLKASREFVKTRPNTTPTKPFKLSKSDLKEQQEQSESIVWFGHSSYLLTVAGLKILVDPVLSEFASPLPGMVRAFAGTGLYTVNDFPEIDVLLITHDHYDHLDYKFVKDLRSRVKQVVCSLGVAAHLKHWGYEGTKITELDWQEEYKTEHFRFKALPARHFSGRGLIRNRSLWSSFLLEVNGKKLFLGGDSGYGPHFKRIGEQEQGFDTVILECGQYNLMWPQIHMQPEQTVQAAIDLQAKVLMPVHWGKFKLALHDWDDSVERVVAEAAKWNLNLLLPAIAERADLHKSYNSYWWRQQK